MKTSFKGIELIKQFEGLRLEAYFCGAGVVTIGYGHTKTAYKGQTITKNEADRLLKDDVTVFENCINSAGIMVNQNQFDALVSFAFNVGCTAFKGSTLLKRIRVNANDPQIRNEFLKWNKAGGVPFGGLTRRRQAESDLYFT